MVRLLCWCSAAALPPTALPSLLPYWGPAASSRMTRMLPGFQRSYKAVMPSGPLDAIPVWFPLLSSLLGISHTLRTSLSVFLSCAFFLFLSQFFFASVSCLCCESHVPVSPLALSPSVTPPSQSSSIALRSIVSCALDAGHHAKRPRTFKS